MSDTIHAGDTPAAEWGEWIRAIVAIGCLAGIVIFTWLRLH